MAASTMKVTHIDSIKKAVGLVLNRRVIVIREYALNGSLQSKCEDAEDTARGLDCWVAFVNRKGNLAHVVRPKCGYMLIRLAGLGLGNASTDYMNKIISRRLYEGLS